MGWLKIQKLEYLVNSWESEEAVEGGWGKAPRKSGIFIVHIAIAWLKTVL